MIVQVESYISLESVVGLIEQLGVKLEVDPGLLQVQYPLDSDLWWLEYWEMVTHMEVY